MVSRSSINPKTNLPFDNVRDLLARDIRELRRVYKDEGLQSDSRLRSEFNTLRLFDNSGKPKVRVPKEFGDTGDKLEPITRAYPKYGKGCSAQLHADHLELKYKNVDILPGK